MVFNIILLSIHICDSVGCMKNMLIKFSDDLMLAVGHCNQQAIKLPKQTKKYSPIFQRNCTLFQTSKSRTPDKNFRQSQDPMSYKKFEQQNKSQTIATIADKNKKGCHQCVKSFHKFVSKMKVLDSIWKQNRETTVHINSKNILLL